MRVSPRVLALASLVVAVVALPVAAASSDDGVDECPDPTPATPTTAAPTTSAAATTVASSTTSVAVTTTSAAATTIRCERVGGSHRYATSQELARFGFEPGVEYVFLVTGQNFPDGTTAGAVAGAVDSPVVLVDHRVANPNADLKALLSWLQPVRIVIVGTTDVLSANYDVQLAPYATEVLRIGGADRYATAAMLARGYPEGSEVVYVTTGLNWPDGLTASAAAAAAPAPVLLVRPDGVPSATAAELERLQPERIVVVGGIASVSDTVLDELGDYAGEVDRIGGDDRYATAAAVSSAVFAPGVPVVYLATGQNFPDALGGGAAAGAWGGPMLLVQPSELPAATAAELERLDPQRIVVIGTDDVITDDVIADALAAAVR